MKVVIQRSLDASVKVNGKTVGKIDKGYVVLVGFSSNDDELVLPKMAKKIINLRIFEDENNKMNYDIKKIDGQILLISQFTLYGDTKNGNRPSFIEAARPEEANKMYEYIIEKCKEKIVTGYVVAFSGT